MRFKLEARTAIRRIGDNALMFPAIDERARRALLSSFPYSVYFTVEAKEVAILAVLINTDIPAPGRRGRDRMAKSLGGVCR